MNRDDIIRLAEEAGTHEGGAANWVNGNRWEQFAFLVAAAAKREWQGLTDEERLRCFDDIDWNKVDWCPDHEQYAKAVEAKLKEKNT
jgi:hypothetical protein